jgi:hypothetical protein
VKTPTSQTELYFGPQVGEIWQEHSYIVYVTDVGCKDSMGRWAPNLARFVHIGQWRPHGDGAYWREDFKHTHGGTSQDDYLHEQSGRCDKSYLKPWNGCGVFFATGDADKMEDLAQKIRECRSTPKKPEQTKLMWDYMEKQENLFLKQMTPRGFV